MIRNGTGCCFSKVKARFFTGKKGDWTYAEVRKFVVTHRYFYIDNDVIQSDLIGALFR